MPNQVGTLALTKKSASEWTHLSLPGWVTSTLTNSEPTAQIRNRPESGRKLKPMVPVATCDEPTFLPSETL